MFGFEFDLIFRASLIMDNINLAVNFCSAVTNMPKLNIVFQAFLSIFQLGIVKSGPCCCYAYLFSNRSVYLIYIPAFP